MAAGGEILATNSVQAAYHEGRGSITVRGKVAVETDSGSGRRGSRGRRKGGDLIVITELPYQTNKVGAGCCPALRPGFRYLKLSGAVSKIYTASAQEAPSVDCGVASQADLVANIADLVNRGVIAGIADVRDESDRTGMRVVAEARTGSAPEVPLLSVVGIATTRSFSVPRSCRNLWPRAPCSSSPVRFVAGHPEQPVQAHSAAVALRLQYGRPGGRHPAVPQPQRLPAAFPGLQVCCTSCVSCL